MTSCLVASLGSGAHVLDDYGGHDVLHLTERSFLAVHQDVDDVVVFGLLPLGLVHQQGEAGFVCCRLQCHAT